MKVFLFYYFLITSNATKYFEKVWDLNINFDPVKYLTLAYYENTMTDSDVYRSIEVESFCQCENICFTVKCLTVSMMMLDGTSRISCNVSVNSVSIKKLKELEGAVTYGLYNGTDFLGKDGLFYYRFRGKHNVTMGEAACEERPNGRLVMTKTKDQFDSVWEYRATIGLINDGHIFILNLIYDPEIHKAAWGDGTPYDQTEISHYLEIEEDPSKPNYILGASSHVQTIKTTSANTFTNAICQGKPMAQD
ncbi:UNVERIFIED_CONTAM: hypothetical protein RMT77_003200 [Armadillidium vulgare]